MDQISYDELLLTVTACTQNCLEKGKMVWYISPNKWNIPFTLMDIKYSSTFLELNKHF